MNGQASSAAVKRVVLTYTPNNHAEWERQTLLLLNRNYGIGEILHAGEIPAELRTSHDVPTSGATFKQKALADEYSRVLLVLKQAASDVLSLISDESMSVLMLADGATEAIRKSDSLELLKLARATHLHSAIGITDQDMEDAIDALKAVKMRHAPGATGMAPHNRRFNEAVARCKALNCAVKEKDFVRIYINSLHGETFMHLAAQFRADPSSPIPIHYH
jgi:hypothetical protein